MGLKMFDALPSYHGGKRRLLGAIFRDVPPPDEAPVFVDAFLGGGSVSLCAKARGYEVLCNDVADRSVIVGRALVENDRVLLGYDDV
ncbi:MAG: DNA adenine methylase, partial [Candidatus Eisenbacteria bacterium]